MSDSNDAALAAEGDYQAFERLYRKYVSRIYSLCARLSGSRKRGAELTADVFVKAWTELPQFKGDGSFGAWLHTLATNVVLAGRNVDENGASASEEAVSASESWRDSASTSSASTSENVGNRDVGEAIDRLPADARRILVLHDVEGYRHEQIAEIFGITAGASKAKLRRARVLLKEALGR
jgi:RNA polymerase sigma factor (sigma-70 family)